MNYRYNLLIPAVLVALLFIGSVSGIPCNIPLGPYIPKSPQEDIVKITAFDDGMGVDLTIDFAAATPPAGQSLYILVTSTQPNPPTETVVHCVSFSDPATQEYKIYVRHGWTTDTPSLAVYAWLSTANTERAPNTGEYKITALFESSNVFTDPETIVGGVVLPTNTLAILTPYLALAGLVIAVSAVIVVKRRRD